MFYYIILCVLHDITGDCLYSFFRDILVMDNHLENRWTHRKSRIQFDGKLCEQSQKIRSVFAFPLERECIGTE